MLDECLRRNRRRFAAEGAEADEVAADLRRHLEFEVCEERLQVVTESDVRRILARVDPKLMEAAETEPPEPARIPEPLEKRVRGRGVDGWVGRSLLWLFGVALPLGTLVAEFFLRLCAEAFLDPLPTPFHVVLVALVPLANTAALLCLRRRGEMPPAWLWWLHSAALGVAATYTVLFLPLTPFAAVGMVFGIGFLPLAPLLSWICGLVLAALLLARARAGDVNPPSRRWLGWVSTSLLLMVLMVPTVLTQQWIRLAANGSEAEQIRTIRLLRRLGNEDQILRAAYGTFSRALEDLGWDRPCGPAQAQEIYFRVTGRAFNSVPPPLSRVSAAGRNLRSEFEWDTALGGGAVAGQVTGLSLLSSRLDASAQPADGWGYTEWTLEFRNVHPRRQREARGVLQLPPGGIVSRVTLWVNGEEREAAFAGRGAARAAYQQVAVAERRDPILVTSAGSDRVLMQCFPIPAEGGVMKVRLGITAPLPVITEQTRAFLWPRLVERNFAVADDFRHHAWLELLSGRAERSGIWQHEAGRAQVLHAAIPERSTHEDLRSVRLQTGGAPGGAWAVDDRGTPPAWVRQRLETSLVKSTGRLALVLDGGRGASVWFKSVQQALAKAHGRGEVAVWVNHDGVHSIFPGAETGFSEVAQALGRWREPFTGGHYPGPALEAALEWAGAAAGGTVLWVHGPQALPSHDFSVVRQRLERSGVGLNLVDVAAVEGPNRLAELLDGSPRFGFLARVGSLEGDLGRFLDRCSGLIPDFRWVAERTESAPTGSVTGSRHLVRLWAAGAVEKLRVDRRREEALALASQWQLVTPVSGAVVLETKEQFARHGLTPVDPLTTPMVVPEPGIWALLAVGLLTLGWRGRRSKAH